MLRRLLPSELPAWVRTQTQTGRSPTSPRRTADASECRWGGEHLPGAGRDHGRERGLLGACDEPDRLRGGGSPGAALLTGEARGRAEPAAQPSVFAGVLPATCGEQPRGGSEMTRTAHCMDAQGGGRSLGDRT